MSEVLGQLFKMLALLSGSCLAIYFLARLLINHGRALQNNDESKANKKEYEKMQKIHSANSAMSASERLDWLRKHYKK